jgi:hypothetical protein
MASNATVFAAIDIPAPEPHRDAEGCAGLRQAA